MYKYYRSSITQEVYEKGIIRIVDNTFIPFDPANTDYQEYLKWVAEGNTPSPAESVDTQPADE